MVTKDKYDSMAEKSVNRTMHAIKRLRANPNYATDTRSLKKRAAAGWDILMKAFKVDDGCDTEVSDYHWAAAVEIAAVCIDPATHKDQSILYGTFIRNNTPIIQALAFLISKVSDAQDQLDDARGIFIKKLVGAFDEKDPAYVELENKLKAKDKELQNLQAAMDTYKSEAAVIQREYENKIKRLEQKLEAVTPIPTVQAPIAESAETATTVISLPTTGIICVGGSPEFVHRLSDIFPNWLYIDGTSTQFNVTNTNAEMVFLFPGNALHKTTYRVKEQLGNRVPIVMCSTTSVNSAISMMEVEYNKKRQS